MGTDSARSVAGSILVVIAVGAAVVGLRREAMRRSLDAPAEERAVARTDSPDVAPRLERVTVYYFHGDTRCATCRAIEAQTARVIQERFVEELVRAELRFESVNFDTPANRHFLDDFDLAFGSVVVQGTGADRPWENLADVWTLIDDDPAAFESYVVEHVRRMLEAAG